MGEYLCYTIYEKRAIFCRSFYSLSSLKSQNITKPSIGLIVIVVLVLVKWEKQGERADGKITDERERGRFKLQMFLPMFVVCHKTHSVHFNNTERCKIYLFR